MPMVARASSSHSQLGAVTLVGREEATRCDPKLMPYSGGFQEGTGERGRSGIMGGTGKGRCGACQVHAVRTLGGWFIDSGKGM